MYSLPVEALNLTVVSKSLPVKVNNAADDLTVSLICPSEVKEKLGTIWSPNVFCSFKLTPG